MLIEIESVFFNDPLGASCNFDSPPPTLSGPSKVQEE